MTAFLLLISIVLHFFTFFILIILHKKFKLAISVDEMKRQKREMEDLLSAYTVEMKEENERFLMQLNERFSSETAQVVSEKKEENHGRTEEYTLPLPEESERYEQSLQAKVFNLFQEGYTANDIAKKLNKGKGEIELLLKFHR